MEQIILKNIFKKYGDNIIFNNFSLAIEAGEFIAITGESGKGKSTMLNIIGLLEKCEGEIFLNGNLINNIGSKKRRELLKNKIGYLFQNYALIDDLTVYDNLKIVMKKEKRNSQVLKMEEALKKVGLTNKHLYQNVYELSGGEQQRVAVARLMLKDCDIILADEPTGSLDKSNSTIIMDLLADLNKQGKTIVMVTHDDKNLKYSNRVVQL